MKADSQNVVRGGLHNESNPSKRRSIRLALLGMGFLCLVVLLAFLWPGRAPQSAQGTQPESTQDTPAAGEQGLPLTQSTTANNGAAARSAPPAHYALPPATAAIRQFVNNLVTPEIPAGGLTEEQAAAWKQRLQQLVQQGAAGLLGIREFLAKNIDFDFGEAGQQALGYTSARAAMIDALTQIGGPLAVNVMAEVLQTTADPREIAVLAKNLETLDPGSHRPMVVDAARQTLTMAAEGNLPDRDVAPLFEVLQQFPDAGTVSDLERTAKQWNYYAVMALAKLPNEEGIPSLIQLAQNGGNSAALTMLAQVAAQSDAARAALVDQARQNKLSIFSWAMLAPILAGAELHFQGSAFDTSLGTVSANDLERTYIPATNQRWFTVPTADSLTSERVQQQAALIDELLSVTSDPAAVQTLQQARLSLSRRATLAAALSGK